MSLHNRNETRRTLSFLRMMRGRAVIMIGALLAASGMSGASHAADVGTLIQFQPNTAALAAEVNANFESIKTAVNSKQDEATAAGIDFSSLPGINLPSDTDSTVSTVALTVPGPGVVEVSFSVRTFINHVFTGSQINNNGLNCQIERDGNILSSSLRGWDVLGTEVTGGRNRPLSINIAFTEAVAGTIEFTATCTKSGPAANASVSRPTLTARFFAQRY